MCGRITLVNLTWPELMDWLTLSTVPDEPIPSSLNRPPTTTIPIVRQGASGAEGAMARWGLVPEWFKGSLREWRASTINARVEEVARKPSFRDAYRHKRCVVLADGYFEWAVRDDGKHPHYIHPAGNAPALLMAGLWSDVHLPDYVGLTATVLTEPVRSPLKAVHDRMPLMLEPAAMAAWLEGCPVEELPWLPMDGLAWHEVSRAVSSVRNDRPELIEPVAPLDPG